MKPIPHLRSARLLSLGIVLIAFVSWSGHRFGKARGHTRVEEISKALQLSLSDGFTSRSDSKTFARDNRETAGSTRGEAEKQLLALYRNSSVIGPDPEILAETKRLLAKMSAAEISAFLKNHLFFDGRNGPIAMHFNVTSLWAAQDPVAALDYLRSSPQIIDQQLAINCFRSWNIDHPAEAMSWYNEGIPSSVRPDDLKSIFANTIGDLVKQDPDLAIREISKLAPDSMPQSLNVLSWELGADPRYRDQILALARVSGEPDVLANTQNNIVSKIAENDPASALNFINSLQADETARANLDASVVLGQIHKAPEAALDAWLARNATLTEIPSVLESAVGTWLYSEKDQAVAWLDRLPAGQQRDGIFSSSVSAMVNQADFSKAAEMADSIESPDLRAEALHTLEQQWKSRQPEQAAAWKAGLTAQDRTILEQR